MLMYGSKEQKKDEPHTKETVYLSKPNRSLFSQVRVKGTIKKNKKEGVKMINDYCVV